MANLRIVKNEDVSDELLKQVALFDKKIFGDDDEFSFPEGYLEKLYKNTRDAIFVLLNKDNVVGYVNAIFLSDESYYDYLNNHDFKKLENIGMHAGDNNMYFYTLAVDEELKHTSCVKMLMYEFSKWLESERMLGKRVNRTICDVISDDGLRASYVMGLVPLNGGPRDFGLYYSPDNLLQYTSQMLESSFSLSDTSVSSLKSSSRNI